MFRVFDPVATRFFSRLVALNRLQPIQVLRGTVEFQDFGRSTSGKKFDRPVPHPSWSSQEAFGFQGGIVSVYVDLFGKGWGGFGHY